MSSSVFHLQNSFDISVIIPNYNRGAELLRAVQSVLEQSFPVYEVIVCDDGSTDDSKSLISKLNNPIVRWLDCGKNGGPAIPRNMGIKHSRGNWIAFLDNDDEWLPSKIEKQIGAIRLSGSSASCTNAIRIRLGKDTGPYSQFEKNAVQMEDLMLGNCIICSSVLVYKKLLMEISLFPEEKKFIAIEDYALWLRLSTRTDFVYSKDTLMKYYDNYETSIRTNYNDSWVIFDIIFKDFVQWMKKNKVKLDVPRKKSLKKLLSKIKRKGMPTRWEEFVRKFNAKFGLDK